MAKDLEEDLITKASTVDRRLILVLSRSHDIKIDLTEGEAALLCHTVPPHRYHDRYCGGLDDERVGGERDSDQCHPDGLPGSTSPAPPLPRV